jgi:AraC-like DNA-binding protein
MVGSGSRVDLPPPGGIAWLDVSAETTDSWPVRIRTGPLGLRIAPLHHSRAPYFLKGARLRGTRCVWSAGTVSGAELSRPGRAPLPEGETTVHLLIRADGSGNVFDPATTMTNAVLKVIDPAAEVLEQFHANTYLLTLNVHVPLTGLEGNAVARMCGQTFALTPFQIALVRAAVGLLLSATDELGTASSLVGIDRYLGSLAGLLLRTAVRQPQDREQIASVRSRTEAIIDEQAMDPTLTPATIAGQLNISLRQLYRAFAGPESPAALIRRRRLERAADLLASRGAIGSVEAIAHECGFPSAEYFSRAFRREFGLSPRAYRSAHRDVPAGTEVSAR